MLVPGTSVTQLFSSFHVEMFQKPERCNEAPAIPLLKERTREEDRISSIACAYHASCGCKRAGLRPGWTSRTNRGASAAAAGSRLCLGRRVSPLGWRTVCMGARSVGSAATSPCRLGLSSLGTPPWRLGADRGTLALIGIERSEKRGFGLAFLFLGSNAHLGMEAFC